ncbi:hypothetical protein CAPN001_06470 [Capnocytophaga stomatis]|uniref:SMI1/KNR4 family protein n=1 Tax=Capnocytophaga stomatis TaxID=1848904 RepID=UPI001951157A|nr:SMI1/KNR4 family protein [Capnocytophaga stomatis]GIJ96078.1 hypothetical protein CAPN001_06470 [Capnocytophaga stomatis]
MNTFKKYKLPASIEDISKLQQHFDIKLPKELINHYLKYNGGYPEKRYFQKDDDFYRIDSFYPITNEGASLFHALECMPFDDLEWFPNYLIPFASTAGGDDFCISIRKEDYGSIWLFLTDYADDWNKAMIFLASSFDNFIHSLQDIEIK